MEGIVDYNGERHLTEFNGFLYISATQVTDGGTWRPSLMKVEDSSSFPVSWAYRIDGAELEGFMIQSMYTTYITEHIYGVAVAKNTTDGSSYKSSNFFLLFIINTNDVAAGSACKQIMVIKIDTLSPLYRRVQLISANTAGVNVFFTENNDTTTLNYISATYGITEYNLPLASWSCDAALVVNSFGSNTPSQNNFQIDVTKQIFGKHC